MGVVGIELDIAPTKDDVLFIMHDSSVDSTTDGTGNCVDITWEYIQTLHAKKDGIVWEDVTIPSFEQVLDYFKGKNCLILAEIKRYDTKPNLAHDVAKMITDKGMENQVYVQSYEEVYMDTVKAYNSNIITGLLGDTTSVELAYAVAHNHNFIAISYSDYPVDTAENIAASTAKVSTVRAANRELFLYTVDGEATAQKYVDIGVDGIIGDYASAFNNLIWLNKLEQNFPYKGNVNPTYRYYDDYIWREVIPQQYDGYDWIDVKATTFID